MDTEMYDYAIPEELPMQPFTEVLFSDEIKDVGMDASEIFLDSFLGEMPILKDIPVLKTFLSFGKTAKSIQAWFEWKNQLVFLNQLKRGTVDAESLKKRNEAYRKKEKWILREVESLVVHMSKYTDIEKSKIQAELYMDLINGIITQGQFAEYIDILVQLFMSDVPHLLEIYRAEEKAGFTQADWEKFDDKIKTKFNISICRRLMAVGLLHQLHPMSFGFSLDDYFIMSDSGKYMCAIILRTMNA